MTVRFLFSQRDRTAKRRASPGQSVSLTALLLLIAASLIGCSRPGLTPSPPPSALPVPALPPIFVDAGKEAGLVYRWDIPGKRPLNILQTIGNGCAFLDYDNDGNLDILLIGPRLALYRGDGKGHFTDVTHALGIDALQGHFLGCAIGDYDNDGFDDIYLSAYQGGMLLHNEKGHRFRNITRSAGLTAQPWGSSATFFDADGDGKLDLYIGNYVDFGPNTSPQLCNSRGVMTGCGPTDYKALRGVLYHNLGGGRFQDVTGAWRLDQAHGRTLGVAAAPFGSPPHISLALSNDETPGDLMRIQHTAAEDIGTLSGMSTAGRSVYGGMGIDWGDYDNDGLLDMAIATYQNQGKLIFRNQGDTFVIQDTAALGMLSSLAYVAFGIKWLDYDNDGWLDLIFANGHVQDNTDKINSVGPLAGITYRQPTFLYHNRQDGRFEDFSARLGAGAERRIVGRGLATGDYDNDGKMDVLVVDSEGSPLLLHNVIPAAGNWLLIRLEGRKCNRDGYGAMVTVEAEGRKRTRHCHADGSYLSSSDKRVHFGLGTAAKIDRLEVLWPDGHQDVFLNVPANQILTLREGASASK